MGLACDEYCRLLTEDGTPIENLYGVGELIMGNVCGGTKQGARYPACGLLPRCRHLRRPHRSAGILSACFPAGFCRCTCRIGRRIRARHQDPFLQRRCQGHGSMRSS